jgi:Mg2+-importing ATPase
METGLSTAEAKTRLKKYGPNLIHKRKINFLTILLRQFTGNPLIIILGVATFISFLLGQHVSSIYIFWMIILSVSLGIWNEYRAEKVVDDLLKKITPTTLVIRDGEKKEIPVHDLTIGDLVLLSQGSIVPADLKLIEAKNIELDESVLTGESKTVYKESSKSDTNKEEDKINIAFMGTHVESGSGKGIVIRIGKNTEFGKIAEAAIFVRPITDFQRGITNFGQLIVKVIIILTIAIFGINTLIGREFLESLLFSLAIAVGLTPELLPVIITVSLSHGAGKLAKKHVVAKQLISIENLGNMDILATDKTGTLTEGKIKVVDYKDSEDKKSEKVLRASLICNSAIVHHKVIGNGIDKALWEYALENKINHVKNYEKIFEEPFDYNRKATFTVIRENPPNQAGNKTILFVKGAPDSIISVCKDIKNKESLADKFLSLNKDGFRIAAIASREIEEKSAYSWKDLNNMTFVGYVTFLDIPKKSAKNAVLKLEKLNVSIKVITGDNEIVTQKIFKEIGLHEGRILSGEQIDQLSDKELEALVNDTSIFARVNPTQKLRIIKALKEMGHTVGFLGDGINDIPALHAADVGISVQGAIDVAQDAASVVLLRKSLDVIADGIIEGRKTFNNTIKYILMGTSSNFGNMASAAGASFFLPFLPMTAPQILLTNALYDISQLSLPSDNVDPESLNKPKHWNVDFIKKYMLFFGPLSSLYDFLTFCVMLFIFHAKDSLFQTGWFIESIATEILVVFIIRTARTPFWKSRPSKYLLTTCLGVVLLAAFLPFSPLAKALGFTTPPTLYFIILTIMVSTYLLLVELVKSMFLKKYSL